jgi:hypothetical protein
LSAEYVHPPANHYAITPLSLTRKNRSGPDRDLERVQHTHKEGKYKEVITMPQQQYIKHLYETEELSINEISDKVGVNWRTAAKHAKRGDWNPVQSTRKRRRPVLEPFTDTIDVWLLEDRLLPRKDRRTAKSIWVLLKKYHGFTGSERTVRAYVAERKKALKHAQQEKYIELEHRIGEVQADFGTVRTIWDGELKEFRFSTTCRRR